jgi:D-serine deaminase-like pyridoxal phosphate-dependent protein
MLWPNLPDDHPTPALVIHRSIARENLRRMQAYCDTHGLKLRPHTKTHKSLLMAEEQIASGASGLTVAKAGEARVMSRASRDILVAYPAVGLRRLHDLIAVARESELTIGIDSIDAAAQLQDAARQGGVVLGILVDLDVGFFRTGVVDPSRAVALGQAISTMQNLRFCGLMCFPGHLLPSSPPQDWERYASALQMVIDQLSASGIPVSTVSGGSTPTATASHRNPFLNEIRPGTYIYNDLNEVRLGVATLDQCAARVLATVVSVPSDRKFIVDAGSKTLSSDRNCVDDQAGFGLVLEFPYAKISRLSEEHGEVTLPENHNDRLPKVGDRVWILPNHICVCVNLQNSFFLLEESSVLEYPVDARGLLT